jgi:putative ABC transport system permease protein
MKTEPRTIQRPAQRAATKTRRRVLPVLQPRWKKVFSDVWSNKTRTLLVVCSILIGVFAVGMTASSQHILSTQLYNSYQQTNPAHISVSTGFTGYGQDYTINTVAENTAGFDEDLVAAIRNMHEVSEAEGRRVFNVRVYVGGITGWQTLQITAIDDYDEMSVNQVQHMRGAWPPEDHQILIERSSLPTLGQDVGDDILMELPDGKQRTMRVAGVVHDLHQWPTPFLGTIYGYINMDTLEWLGEPREFNQLQIQVAEHADNKAHNQAVAQEVYDKVQRAGLDPSFPQVPEPGEPPLNFIITAITALMGVMGLFSILLSAFLVVNTISALLAQQTRQIGIMKAVGGRTSQIVTMYLVLVLCFGLIALLPALPLAQAATEGFTSYIANFLNFTVDDTSIPPYVIGMQVAISLLVPVLAALMPVFSGTRVSVREAFDNSGVSSNYGQGWIDRLIRSIRGLPRPLLLSLRNTFRRKGRMALTLATLTLGGAFFISVFSIRDSLWLTMNTLTDSLYNYDVEMYLDRTYRADYLVREAEEVPGVVAAEVQVQTTVRQVFPGDREGEKIQLFAVPPDTPTMQPQMFEGRWLLPEDENALVISTGFSQKDNVQVGNEITLKVKDRETAWRVVGVIRTLGDYRWAYASYDYYSHVAKDVGEASYLRIRATEHTPEAQAQVARNVEDHFQRIGIDVSSRKTMEEFSQGDREAVQVIVASLLSMAVLVAAVGGLGLAGTMSLNVIERVREIGVMRSIGASDGAVLQIFIIEGVLIGLISWALGAVLALPVSKLMSDAMGDMLFSSPLHFSFSVSGILIWLTIAVFLSAIASYLPARNATRVSVREVLAYE